MKNILSKSMMVLVAWLAAQTQVMGWDYEGHRLVNQLALSALPQDFPAFVKTPEAKERIAFLAGEPDRWRNTPDLPLKHFNAPDHYLDIDDLALYGLDVNTLPMFRYVFTVKLAEGRAKNAAKIPPIDPTKNEDQTRELVGFLPWAIAENYGKLKSGFSTLKAFQENGGTPEEIANAQQNIIYIMGVLGHFVGDGAQPLHTTKHFNGWVGANPNGYSTNKSFHSWIDGGYFQKIGGAELTEMARAMRPAKMLMVEGRPVRAQETFPVAMNYIQEQFRLVEPLYKMDKEGKLSGGGETGMEGKVFLSRQLIKGGQMLGDLWVTAWQQAPEDTYLKSALAKRKLGAAAGEKKP